MMTILFIIFLILEFPMHNGFSMNHFDDHLGYAWFLLFMVLIPPLITIASILYALIRTKRWIKSELAEPYGRKWKCKRDGYFVVYFTLVLISYILSSANLMAQIFNEKYKSTALHHVWNILTIVDWISRLGATSFVLCFLAKMSRAIWSRRLPLEERNK